jgi:hypothetical protein
MAAPNTVKVKMLGNHLELEVGKVYDLPVEIANQLTGIGYAAFVGSAPAEELPEEGN